MSNYFGVKTDQAIVAFKTAANIAEKNKIFIEEISPAFEKLINYHYYRIPVARNVEIKSDCLSFLYEKIDKFDSSLHTRGFPYFNMIVKHFFIQQLKTEKKKVDNDQLVIHLNSSVSEESAQKKNYSYDIFIVDAPEKELEKKEFLDIFKVHLKKWRDTAQKSQDKVFIDALVMIFDNAENLDIFNKKAIFFYLREITGLKSKQIAIKLNKVKKKYLSLKRRYEKGDV